MVAVLRGHRIGGRYEQASGLRRLSDLDNRCSLNMDDAKREKDRGIYDRMIGEASKLNGLLERDRDCSAGTVGTESVPATEAPPTSGVMGLSGHSVCGPCVGIHSVL